MFHNCKVYNFLLSKVTFWISNRNWVCSPLSAFSEEHRFGMLQNSSEKPKYKMVSVYFISVLVCVLCKCRVLADCPDTFLSSMMWCLLYHIFFLFCILIFHVFPPGFVSNYFWPQLLNADFFCLFVFQGMDNIISLLLCSIFGCVVLPWWTDNPVPAEIFSACHKCCFCIPRRAGTLWSFDSAQQGREGQPAKVPNVRRQFKEQREKMFFPLPYDLPLAPSLTPPACEFEMKT